MHRKKHSNKYVKYSSINRKIICSKPRSSSVNKNDSVINSQTETTFEIQENMDVSFHDCVPEPIVFSMPGPSKNTILLSNNAENRQAYVIIEDKKEILVIISKVQNKFIMCCSCCSNQTDFLLCIESKILNTHIENPLLNCRHAKQAISKTLDLFNRWKSQIEEDELIHILNESLSIESTKEVFIKEGEKYRACILPNYGIFLFVYKQGKWRCVACKGRIVEKCSHSQLINFEENIFEREAIEVIIGASENPIIGNSTISCK